MRGIYQPQSTNSAQGSPGIGVVQTSAQLAAQTRASAAVLGPGVANTGAGNFASEIDAARAAKWKRLNGEIWWPPHDGAVPGTEQKRILPAGTIVGRIGSDRGTYVAPPGTPPEQLSLCPGTDTSVYSEYKVVKPIPDVKQATVAPWFDQPGGGTQYKLPESIKDLVLKGYMQMM